MASRPSSFAAGGGGGGASSHMRTAASSTSSNQGSTAAAAAPSNSGSSSSSSSSSSNSNRTRQYAHLHAALAQLNAHLADTENLLRMTAVQAEYVRGLGGWSGGLFMAAAKVLGEEAAGTGNIGAAAAATGAVGAKADKAVESSVFEQSVGEAS